MPKRKISAFEKLSRAHGLVREFLEQGMTSSSVIGEHVQMILGSFPEHEDIDIENNTKENLALLYAELDEVIAAAKSFKRQIRTGDK